MATTDSDRSFAGSIPRIYEAYLVPMIFEPYARDLAERTAALHATRILEIAAGTGVVTRLLAATLGPGAAIVATDLNPAMLEHAQTIAAPRSVTWQTADALSLPFDDASFDIVVCQFGVMFFPDRPRGYAEARRVLKPGGTFLFNAWDAIGHNDFAACVTDAAATVFPDDPPRFLARTPHGYSEAATIRDDLRAAGFAAHADIASIDEPSRAPAADFPAIGFCHGTPLRNEIEARDAARLGDVVGAATDVIASRFGAHAIEGRMRANVVTVRR